MISSFSCASNAESLIEIEKKIRKNMEGIQIDQLKPTPIPGLYEMLAGNEVAYITADANHMLQGVLYNVPERKNLTDGTLKKMRTKALGKIKDSALVIYPATGVEKVRVTVFTDPTCPYCVSLHRNLKNYNDAGITIKYALYPRASGRTLLDRQISDILCSVDKKEATNKLFSQPSMDSTGSTCENANQLATIKNVARQAGLEGTPFLVFDSGEAQNGVIQPHEIIAKFAEKN